MGFITYKQADSRWGKLSYNGSSSMATAGCGPTSCAMLAYGVDGKTTPLDTMRFMQKNGYAIRNNGTAWNGIPACLKAFGLEDVQEVNVNSSMSKVWELMSKGYVGVFLFRSGSKGGITWTTSGHYVAVTDYKVENGKHYLYTRDSGGRNHTGWYCYETQMKGLIPKVWCGYVKTTPEVIPDYPTVTLKNGATGTQVKSLQKCLNNFINAGLTVDGNFGAKTDAAVKAFQKKYGLTEDGIVGPKTIAMLKNPVIPVQTNVPTTKIGKAVDVSYWQHSIDWVKAAADGVTHAICRASYTSQDKFTLNSDSTFSGNIESAYAAGVKVGAYHYSQAISESEAKKEAEYIVNILASYKSKITLPIVLDWEFGKRLNASKAKALGKTKCTAICKAFCDVVSAAGYTPMVYANYTAFKNYLTLSEIRKFAKVWLAQYNDSKSIENVDWWQYTSSGSVKGITGKVDMNHVYEPAATVQTSGEKIAAKALELAWPKGTASAKYKYPAGAATSAFKDALDKVYSTHKKWGKAPSVGASCDVFAGTVIRSCGIDAGMPRGLDEQFSYFAKSVKWSKIAKPSADSVQEGDVILYHKTSSGGHICIVVKIGGKLYVAEASYQQNFGHIADSLKTRMSMTGKKDLFVYRAK